MTYPCINEDELSGPDLTPLDYMQWRHVATNSAASVNPTYDIDGGNQAADLFELQVAWTNPDPVSARVYGLLTRGGSTVTTTARTRLYIETYFGQTSGVAPADPVASTLFGRTGNGVDFQRARIPITDTTINFGLCQTRQAERSMLIGTTTLLAPGEGYKLRVRLRVDAGFWETVPPEGNDAETLLSVVTGATRLDLYSYPEIV